MTLFPRDSLERMGVTTRSVQSEKGPRVKPHRNAKTTPAMRALIAHHHRVGLFHLTVLVKIDEPGGHHMAANVKG